MRVSFGIRNENKKEKGKQEFCAQRQQLSCSKSMALFVILLTWLMMAGTDGRDLPVPSVTGKKL